MILRAFRLDAAAGEFDGREDQGRLGSTDAGELREVFGFHVQPLLVNDPRQLGGQRHHVHAWRAFADQHSQQFLVAQRCRAFAQELLAGSIGLGDVMDRFAHGLRQPGINGSG